ncbi:MAG: UDP-N-acetylglucosamine 2-epimerase, partial [Acidobacteria bacterium RBG_16_68_9]
THVAAWHFAPTERARQNLLREGVPAARVVVTGNTIVDALQQIAARLRKGAVRVLPAVPPEAMAGRRMLLVTGHRRESFGEGLRNICLALLEIVRRHEDVLVVYPVHLNPAVQQPVRTLLADHPRILLTPPLDYLSFVDLMQRAHLVLTDSGGIQEEAPSLRLPVLVMRETSERPEGIEAGVAQLVGTRTDTIVAATERMLTDHDAYEQMRATRNPYGDGHAADAIVSHLEQALGTRVA